MATTDVTPAPMEIDQAEVALKNIREGLKALGKEDSDK